MCGPCASSLRRTRVDFDPAEAGHGMLCGNLDGLVEAGALEQIEAAEPFPGLGKRTVRNQHLALAPTHGPGVVHTLETMAEDPRFPAVDHVDPILDVVLGGHIWLAFWIAAYEHQVSHRPLLFNVRTP